MHCAALMGHLSVVELLLEYDPTVNIKDRQGVCLCFFTSSFYLFSLFQSLTLCKQWAHLNCFCFRLRLCIRPVRKISMLSQSFLLKRQVIPGVFRTACYTMSALINSTYYIRVRTWIWRQAAVNLRSMWHAFTQHHAVLNWYSYTAAMFMLLIITVRCVFQGQQLDHNTEQLTSLYEYRKQCIAQGSRVGKLRHRGMAIRWKRVGESCRLQWQYSSAYCHCKGSDGYW